MKRVISAVGFALAIVIALSLAACQTTSGVPPTASEVISRACPPLNATMVVLENSPTVSDKLRERLNEVHPLVKTVCSGELPALPADLHALEDVAIPVIIDVIADSSMNDKQKNVAILSVAVAQAVLASVR
ncbi:MAG: hypothetical protein IPG22_06400 [Acidobacteria bacterium]|nr:hypothetical protein [Acidobacteriota bacterium]